MVLGWAGLGMVLATGIIIPATWRFPGAAALLPVTGAAIFIVSGFKPVPSDVRLLLALANLSFALYLWHWPVLIFEMGTPSARFPNLRTGVAIDAPLH